MSFWRLVWKMWIQALWWPALSCVKSCVDHLWPRLVHVIKNHKAFVACNNPCFARAAGMIWGFAGQLCWIWRAEAHRTSWGPGSGLTSAASYRRYWHKLQATPPWGCGERHSTLTSVVATAPNSQGKGNERRDRQSKRPFWWRNMLFPKIYSPRDAFF